MSRRYLSVLRRNLIQTLRRSDCEESVALLQRVRDEDPLGIETRGLELEYAVRCGSAGEARALADQLVGLFPDSARILHWAGRAAYRLRDYETAISRLRESGRVAPHPQTDRWLGKALTQAGQLEEAEALLRPLVDRNDWVYRDLAWLYERRGDAERAKGAIRAHLERHPEDSFASKQLVRLSAVAMDAETLRSDVESLLAFGEDIPDELLPEYIDALIRTGAASNARALVQDLLPQLPPKLATAIGWKAYKLQAYDLALNLFVASGDTNLGNPKFLNALQKAARICRRVEDVIVLYQQHADRLPNLHGRIKKLSRLLDEPDE